MQDVQVSGLKLASCTRTFCKRVRLGSTANQNLDVRRDGFSCTVRVKDESWMQGYVSSFTRGLRIKTSHALSLLLSSQHCQWQSFWCDESCFMFSHIIWLPFSLSDSQPNGTQHYYKQDLGLNFGLCENSTKYNKGLVEQKCCIFSLKPAITRLDCQAVTCWHISADTL